MALGWLEFIILWYDVCALGRLTVSQKYLESYKENFVLNKKCKQLSSDLWIRCGMLENIQGIRNTGILSYPRKKLNKRYWIRWRES